MKKVFGLICISLLIAVGSLGCVFNVDKSTRYESKETMKRLESLECRVGQVEGCQAQCPLTAKPACVMTPEQK